MEHYITYNFQAYSPKNTKHAEMVEFADKFEHIVIEGKIGYDAFIQVLKNEMEKLNEKYPKQKTMQFRKQPSEAGRIDVYFPSSDGNTERDQTVFYMAIAKVQGFFQFSESVPKKEIEDTKICKYCKEKIKEEYNLIKLDSGIFMHRGCYIDYMN